MKRNQIIAAVVILIVVAGGAFYGGDAYGKSAAPARGGFTAGTGGTFAGRTGTAGGRGAGGFTTGQIISSGNGSITIQSAMSSSTEIVLVGDSTQISKSVSGSLSDLTPGTEVVVTGSTNSDGSLTAQSIQVRPAGSSAVGGFGGAARAGGSTQTQSQ